MSLINDALKKASEARPSLDPDLSAPALRPAEERPRSVWPWVWCAVGLLLAGFLAMWAIVMGVIADRELKVNQLAAAREMKTAANPVPPVVEPAPTTKTGVLVSNTNAEKSAHAPVPAIPEERPLGDSNQEQTANASTNAVASVPVAAEPPKPVVPVLKLQGIIFKPAKPLAMINSKMVGRGDKILNARVVAIDQESVTLDKGGEKVVLTLP